MGSAFWRRNDCDRVEGRLEEYISGAMPEGEEREKIKAHLGQCARCRESVAAYQRSEEAFTVFAARPIPERPGDWSAVRARLEKDTAQEAHRERVPLFGPRLFLGGAVATCLAAIAILCPNPMKPRYADAESLNYSPDTVRPANNPNPAQAQMLVERSTPNVRQEPRRQDLYNYVSVGKGLNTLTAAPAFLDLPTTGVFPIVLEIGNPGGATDAKVSVFGAGRDFTSSTYNYTLPLKEKGVSRFIIYPTVGPLVGPIPENGQQMRFFVNLKVKDRVQSVELSMPFLRSEERVIAYAGKRLGVLSPRQTQDRDRSKNSIWPRDPMPDRRATYIRPDCLPDRAVGYDAIGMLVLSAEAQNLNEAQWKAIREWVVTGGSLVLTDKKLLENGTAAELSPVRLQNTALGTKVSPKSGALVTKTILARDGGAPDQKVVRRSLGAGSVLYTTFDPVAAELRDKIYYGLLWNEIWYFGMIHRPLGSNDAMLLGGYRHLLSPNLFKETAHDPNVSASKNTVKNDPFQVALPPITFVVYYFLGYFVLVIPVTFFVLKHTRRMNAAWFTGPVIASVFAGTTLLMTLRLAMTPTSQRTRGVVFLASGDAEGRFVGFTELFFPKEGNPEATLHNWELIEARMQSFEQGTPMAIRRRVTDQGEQPADLTFINTNLTFRRLHLEGQTRLPGRIVVAVHEDEKGRLVGYIDNQTGKPLKDAALTRWRAYIERRQISYVKPDGTQVKNEEPMERMGPQRFPLGTLPAGRTTISVDAYKRDKAGLEERFDSMNIYGPVPLLASGVVDTYRQYSVPRNLGLMAQVSGKDFGPRIGKDFSGDDSVTIFVGADSLGNGGKQ